MEKYICSICGDDFPSKKKIITHLKSEIAECRDIVYNNESAIDDGQKQLTELGVKQ